MDQVGAVLGAANWLVLRQRRSGDGASLLGS